MARPVRRTSISLEAKAVLDYLCTQPAKVHDFAEIADAITLDGGLKIKRGMVQQAISELRTGRTGDHLKDLGPDGMRLRARHAYLPASSPARADFPVIEHPPEALIEHPSVVALRTAVVEQAEEKRRDAEILRGANDERLQVTRAEKLERRLQRVRQKNGMEADEVRLVIPTIDEVIQAGYARHVAIGIVAEQNAIAAGMSPQDARDAGDAAMTAEVMANPTDESPREAAWTSDEEVERALGADAPIITREPPQLSGADENDAHVGPDEPVAETSLGFAMPDAIERAFTPDDLGTVITTNPPIRKMPIPPQTNKKRRAREGL